MSSCAGVRACVADSLADNAAAAAEIVTLSEGGADKLLAGFDVALAGGALYGGVPVLPMLWYDKIP